MHTLFAPHKTGKDMSHLVPNLNGALTYLNQGN